MTAYPEQDRPDRLPDPAIYQWPTPDYDYEPPADTGGYAWPTAVPLADGGDNGWHDRRHRPEDRDLAPEPDRAGPPEFARARDGARYPDRFRGLSEDDAWAILAYMSAAFFGFLPPLVIYLLRHRSPVTRRHAVQAVNTSATVFLYLICILIVGGLLALDSVTFALVAGGLAAALLWLVTIAALLRATTAASRGRFVKIPGWLCATFLRR